MLQGDLGTGVILGVHCGRKDPGRRDLGARSQLCRHGTGHTQQREQQMQRPRGRNEQGVLRTRKKTVVAERGG